MAKKIEQKTQQPGVSAPMLRRNDKNESHEAVGTRLRELRRAQGLSLQALAEKSGLSVNTISLIENSKTSPIVSTLQCIAIALNQPIKAFFDIGTKPEPVIYTKHEQRQKKDFPQGQQEDLGCIGLQSYLISFNPKSSSQQIFNDVNEFNFCLSGKLIYKIAEKEYILEPGDSLLISPKIPHTWRNPSEDVCKVISFYYIYNK